MLSKSGLALLLILFSIGCQQVTANPESEEILAKLDSTGDLLTATRVKEVPIDPADPAWGTAKETVVPLVSQSSVVPRASVFKRSEVSVRALFSKKEVALLLSWDDPTQDELESAVTRFRDAVAVGVPVNFQKTAVLPYIGMGHKGHPMNIWQWKASWQADVDRGYQGIAETHPQMVPNSVPILYRTAEEAGSPMAQLKRTSPVENLLAEGFGSLTSVPDKNLVGKGVWQAQGAVEGEARSGSAGRGGDASPSKGRWSVVIKRTRDFKGLVPITFSVWDGAGAERNGMKGLTRWRFLHLAGELLPHQFLKSLIVGPIPGADPARGRQLTTDLGCVSCHNLPDSPAVNDVGPDLAHAGGIHRPEYLLESIKEPNAVVVPAPGYFDPQTGTSTMPSFGDQIPEKDYHDIVEYLRNL